MNEQRSVSDEIALNVMGLSYVKIPRYTLNLLRNTSSRQLELLHLTLFNICFYVDGVAKFKDRKIQLKRGEYVGTQKELSDLTGINIGSINRLIRELEALHLISVTRIQGGSLIRVDGYTALIGDPTMPEKRKKRKRKS